MKRVSFLLILGVVVIVIFVGYSGYVFWQKSAREGELQTLTASITDYKNKVLEKEAASVTKAINAKQTVKELKADLIEWSKVIKRIRSTIPKEDNIPLVQVLSYSGSSGSDISMNVKTMPDREAPYFDVADLIAAFVDSKSFAEVFVPSISAGTDEKGKEILTFLVNMKYVHVAEEEKIEEALSEVLDKSLKDESIKTDEATGETAGESTDSDTSVSR